MIDINAGMDIHNKFHIKKYTDGVLVKEAFAYNTVLKNNLRQAMFTEYYISSVFKSIAVGTGSTPPTPTDTSLQTFLDHAPTTVTGRTYAYPTSTLNLSATMQADVTKTGNISEVGLEFTGHLTLVVTRALLQDAEGNPITIEKGPNDVLIITATVYITWTDNYDIRPISPRGNLIIRALMSDLSTSYELRKYMSSTSICAAISSALAVMYSNGLYSTLFDSAVRMPYGDLGGNYTPYKIPTNVSGNLRIVQYAREGTVSQCNGHMMHYIVTHLGIKKIASDQFIPYTTKPMSVGIGNGVATDFVCPIPQFVENSDIVKVGNVTLTRGVDYTIDPIGNSLLDKACGIPAHAALMNNQTYSDSPLTHFKPFMTYYPGKTCFYTTLAYGSGIAYAADHLLFEAIEVMPCNTLYVPQIEIYVSRQGAFEGHLLLEYSLDGLEWHEAGRTESFSFSRASSTGGYTLHEFSSPKVTFSSITAKHWKVTIVMTTLPSGFSSYVKITEPTSRAFFGYVGEGLKFNSPPASGEVITIQAQLTKPFKTEEYVLDHNIQLDYTW